MPESDFESAPIPAPELRGKGAPITDQESTSTPGPSPVVPCGSMTLLDWFAGQALSAIVMGDIHATRYESESMAMAYARKAYEYAEAMIRVREEMGRG